MGEAKENLINQFGYGAACEGDYDPDYPQAFEEDQSQDLAAVTDENQGAAETADAVA